MCVNLKYSDVKIKKKEKCTALTGNVPSLAVTIPG